MLGCLCQIFISCGFPWLFVSLLYRRMFWNEHFVHGNVKKVIFVVIESSLCSEDCQEKQSHRHGLFSCNYALKYLSCFYLIYFNLDWHKKCTYLY